MDFFPICKPYLGANCKKKCVDVWLGVRNVDCNWNVVVKTSSSSLVLDLCLHRVVITQIESQTLKSDYTIYVRILTGRATCWVCTGHSCSIILICYAIFSRCLLENSVIIWICALTHLQSVMLYSNNMGFLHIFIFISLWSVWPEEERSNSSTSPFSSFHHWNKWINLLYVELCSAIFSRYAIVSVINHH